MRPNTGSSVSAEKNMSNRAFQSGETRTERLRVDPGHRLVPDLPPHKHAAALARVEAVIRRERAVVEPEALVRADGGDFDALRRRGLRNEEQDVAVVRRAALRMRRDVGRVCGRQGNRVL